MARYPASRRLRGGFSLLEVLIAVLVLATGLIALAALQGALARGSAESKVRGRVAAMLTARMDALRSGGYGLLADGTVTQTSTNGDCDDASPDATDWIDCTRLQANLGSLTATQTVATWYGAAGFATPPPNPQDPRVAQFKRVTLGASWTDAAGDAHQVAETSDISPLALTNFLVPPPQDIATSAGNGPLVRTADPATAGVIPIALGEGDDGAQAATSNPTPELVGQKNNQKVVGTRFTVLNYTPADVGGVVIQKRFENEVVKCACRFGAGGTNLPEIYRTAQWPAVWTGERYDLYRLASEATAPGQAASSGPRPDVKDSESPLCQECCRDHHDGDASDVARFDPERRDNSHGKFDFNGTALVAASSGNYVDACRVIRVDGFWRTAADMYARQFGLLETTSDGSGVAAKSGVPTSSAVNAYTGFVKTYLAQYTGTTGNAPGNAQSLFDAVAALNVPAAINIATASNSDYRYLHGRGLYVDYLEDKARTKLQQVLADTGTDGLCPSGRSAEDCVMPYLPFVTANLTEIASWLASDTSILTVNSGNLLSTCTDGTSPCPQFPSGGRTIGKAPGNANNTASMRLSNSGVAVNALLPTALGGVDPTDDADTLSDAQPFTVGGSTATGPTFDVRVSGGGANPFVFFTLGSDVDKECLKPANSDNHCVTATGTLLPQPGSVKVSNYWLETTTTHSVTANCGGQTATDTIAVPLFRNYAVTAASISGVAGVVGAAVNDGKTSESTAITFSSIPAGALVLITLAEQAGSPTEATIASCTTNGGRNKIQNIVWTKPWTQP